MADKFKDQDELTEEEAAKRRDEALKRALGTPPKPRKIKKVDTGKEFDSTRRGGGHRPTDKPS